MDSILDLFALIFIGSFWLGYVYIKADGRVRLAQAQRGERVESVGDLDARALKNEIADLRRQVMELRETTTAYDLSFDTALRRIEHQVENELAQRVGRG